MTDQRLDFVDQTFHEKEEDQEREEKDIERELDVLDVLALLLNQWYGFVFTHSNF